MDSYICDRERQREEKKKCAELFMVVKIDILFALEFSGNCFLNACNCFKGAQPLTQRESLISAQYARSLREPPRTSFKTCFYNINSKAVPVRL